MKRRFPSRPVGLSPRTRTLSTQPRPQGFGRAPTYTGPKPSLLPWRPQSELLTGRRGVRTESKLWWMWIGRVRVRSHLFAGLLCFCSRARLRRIALASRTRRATADASRRLRFSPLEVVRVVGPAVSFSRSSPIFYPFDRVLFPSRLTRLHSCLYVRIVMCTKKIWVCEITNRVLSDSGDVLKWISIPDTARCAPTFNAARRGCQCIAAAM